MSFKETFKYYKSRKEPPDLKFVIDFDNIDANKVKKLIVPTIDRTDERKFGLRTSKDWKIYEILSIPGLIFIRNPFTVEGQRHWILKCLKDYPNKRNKCNLNVEKNLENYESLWDLFETDRKNTWEKLRWVTMGYHHDWNTKVYSEDSKTAMPKELVEFLDFLGSILGFSDFKAEAAIINYYRKNSTLAGHVDHSEISLEAPLFSLSFGSTAIFLIGGCTQEEPAEAMFLKTGDIVVMSGGSRLRYHGIPRILPSQETLEEHDSVSTEDWLKAKSYIKEARINVNVRQVLKTGQTVLK